MTRKATYETRDATIWCVTEADGQTGWEAKVGVHKLQLFETEDHALDYVRRWEPEARHDREIFDEGPRRPR